MLKVIQSTKHQIQVITKVSSDVDTAKKDSIQEL